MSTCTTTERLPVRRMRATARAGPTLIGRRIADEQVGRSDRVPERSYALPRAGRGHIGHRGDQTALQAARGVDGAFVDGHLHDHAAVRRRNLSQAELIEELPQRSPRIMESPRGSRTTTLPAFFDARCVRSLVRRERTRGHRGDGTEVLTGRVQDRNGPWIADRLLELGVELAHITICGDRPDDIEAQLRFLATEGVDLIVTSGGLGPTADDMTVAMVARFCGREWCWTRTSRPGSAISCSV